MEKKIVKYHVNVFVTKKLKFRARVFEIFDDESKITTEVTVGGENWKEGKLLKYQNEILNKCQRIVMCLDSKYHKIRF